MEVFVMYLVSRIRLSDDGESEIPNVHEMDYK